MRCYAEHTQNKHEINHPSNAKVWKYLSSVHPDFASNIHNFYLGLCINGFNPSEMSSRQYSLLPVLLTPYNFHERYVWKGIPFHEYIDTWT